MIEIPKHITMREFEKIMLAVGFVRGRTRGRHNLFHYPDTNVTITLPRTRYAGRAHISLVRRILDESDIFSKEEFDSLVTEALLRKY